MRRGTVWFTGLSGAGKSTAAATLKQRLDALEVPTLLLEGDDLREGLNSDLGFSESDRRENVRRVGEVALLLSTVGHIVLVTVISPFAAGRERVRARHDAEGVPFLEVHVATPLDVCEQRDPKGLYARARRGEIPMFTGISSPYEPPSNPDLSLSTTDHTPFETADKVLALLGARGLVAPR
ncbi:MAG: adenylyl-sulfate kinase [Acidimicrobiales bacterium]